MTSSKVKPTIMKRNQFYVKTVIIFAALLQLLTFSSCKNNSSSPNDEENDKYDGPSEIAAMEYKRTMDPALRRVPRERLIDALNQTELSKANAPLSISAYGNWTERGPNTDVVGPSNGNTRANSGITSGRIRAILVDAADVTGNTVWIGGVNGGLWKTTDISSSPATWTLVNDFFSNMAITGICQNPVSTSTMYFCTGEWPFNVDAVAGDGIFKSTNGGVTWTQLSSTTGTNFDYCSKILCDATGNVYVSTRSGVYRSTDGGTTWTTITPTGLSTARFSDMELSNTGRLHVSAGQFSTCGYRYTDNPSTVTSATWTSPAAGYPASAVRIELGCSGNTLYALPSDNSYQVPTIYKSTDGGANWAATTGQPTAGWASQQAWYALAVDIDPANSNNVIVGGLEAYKTTDGGATWTRISRWVGTTGQYVHADIHFIDYYGTNRVLFGCDGGIHYSGDGGTTIRDRNQGLRLKQFYSVAVHPTTTNHFLAGAQDNGMHLLTSAGLGGSTEVIGGDGAFSAIDQNESSYQFGSYVYNVYRRSTNDGANWGTVTFYKGSPGTYNVNYFDFGDFINPWDYDNTANIIYAGADADEFFRWTTPQTTGTGTYYSSTTWGIANAAVVPLTNLGGGSVTNVYVSPYTANRVYFGGSNGRVLYLDGANTAARPGGTEAVGVNITGASFPAGTVSCIAAGTNDNNLMVSFSNYGVNNVWVSSNGGTTWTAIDGNLPDMPVRWCMFAPGTSNTKAIIATEAGVYLTQLINGGSTVWLASPSFPTVRTDMIKYRSSDGLIVAATHGRGLWSQGLLSILPLNNFMLRGRWASPSSAELAWDFAESNTGGTFTVEFSSDGQHFTSGGTVATVSGRDNYSYNHQPGQGNIIYRIKHTSATGKILYSNSIKLSRSGAAANLQISTLFPNPVHSELSVAFTNGEKGRAVYTITGINGQVSWKKEENLTYTGSNKRTWNTDMLSAGTYILTISMGNQRVSQKFIKQ